MASFFGSADSVAALLVRPSNQLMSYIDNSVNRFTAAAESVGLEIGGYVTAQHQSFIESNLGQQAVAIRNMINNYWQADSIRPLPTIGDIQQAPVTMQRWVMTHPELRELSQAGRVEGFADTYVDVNPSAVGVDQYDWRLLNDGIVRTVEGVTQYSNFYEAPLPDDYALTIIDKISILATHVVIDEAIEEGGVDPTSPWNNTMG